MRMGTSTAAPKICMLVKTIGVDMGTGGVGIINGRKSDRISTTRDIAR